jgi:quinol monooxygenase YgiN
MSVVVVVEFVPAPGHEAELLAALVAAVPAVHAEEGCELYTLQTADDGRIFMVEKWTSVELLDRHAAGAAVRALDASIADHIEREPVVERLTPAPAGTDAQGRL